MPPTYVIDVGGQSVDLRLGEPLRRDFAHDVAESQQGLVIEFGRPSIGEGKQAPRRQLADEKARRQVRRSPRTTELELRIRRFTRISGG